MEEENNIGCLGMICYLLVITAILVWWFSGSIHVSSVFDGWLPDYP